MTGRLEYVGERTDLAAVNKLFGNAMIIGITAMTSPGSFGFSSPRS